MRGQPGTTGESPRSALVASRSCAQVVGNIYPSSVAIRTFITMYCFYFYAGMVIALRKVFHECWGIKKFLCMLCSSIPERSMFIRSILCRGHHRPVTLDRLGNAVRVIILISCGWTCAATGTASAGTITVHATDSVWGDNGSTAAGGTAPSGVIAAAGGEVLQFSNVTGSLASYGATPAHRRMVASRRGRAPT